MAPRSTSAFTTSTDYNGGGAATTISTIHPDVLQTHILPLLDGLTLTSLSSTSSYFHSISTSEPLWSDICISTWPSTNHPCIRNLIAAFPAGHRSFFSDSFSLLSPHLLDPIDHNHPSSPPPSEIISAIDIHYQDQLIFSKVQESHTTISGRFENRPFKVDLLDPKENILTPVRINSQTELGENLRLSWIIIDPKRKRAVNISSLRPVRVYRHWSTGDIRVKYETTMAGLSSESPLVECKVVVTCSQEEEGGKVHLRKVCMQVEDMDEKCMNWKDSLEIFASAMERGKRKKRGDDEKERYEEYLEEKRQRRERNMKREKRMKMACFVGLGMCISASWWLFA
ncbi:hypothetical protein Ancab_011289 [Ancistrocladus abbreviatus]